MIFARVFGGSEQRLIVEKYGDKLRLSIAELGVSNSVEMPSAAALEFQQALLAAFHPLNAFMASPIDVHGIAHRILERRPAEEIPVHGSKFDSLLNEAKALAEFLLGAGEGTLQRGRRDEASIEDRVTTLETQMEQVMSDIDTLNQTLDALAEDANRVAAKQSNLVAEIEELHAQVSAGQPVDLSGVLAKATNIKTTLDAIAGAASTTADTGADTSGTDDTGAGPGDGSADTGAADTSGSDGSGTTDSGADTTSSDTSGSDQSTGTGADTSGADSSAGSDNTTDEAAQTS